MSRPSYLSQPLIQRLPNLLREVRDGEIRIPRFQRPFIWSGEQQLLLLQSIYQGMPIGSFLIWRTKEQDLRCYDRLGPLRLGWSSRDQGNETGSTRQYLLDGHQRLTTLYVALGGGLSAGEATSDLDRDSETDADNENWPIFFDLEERVFTYGRKRARPPARWLPLSILFDPTRLYEFQKKLIEGGVDRNLINRAESLASSFKDYSIPVVPIVTEDLELATESFQRVNSGGTRMNEVHMVSALTWTKTFDLNERIEEMKVELGEVGWQATEAKNILNICKAFLNLDLYDAEVQAIKGALRENPDILQRVTCALKEVAAFLRERCKVYGPVSLPYSWQVVLLADGLRIATSNFERKLGSDQAVALERWFWLTTYGEYFSGISAGRLAKTHVHLRSVVEQGIDPLPPGLVREIRWLRRFDLKTARSRAIALRLADLQAVGVPPVPDPYQLLEEHGRTAVAVILTRREFSDPSVEGPENRILVHPRDVTNIRYRLRECSGTDSRLYEAHGIDTMAAEALVTGRFCEFLARRRATLLALERTFVEKLGLSYNEEP